MALHFPRRRTFAYILTSATQYCSKTVFSGGRDEEVSEEQVTRAILKWLAKSGWTILDYDFPGGGTGRKFHVFDDSYSKTKGIVVPDIIAIRGDRVIVFENKSVDTLSDYDKLSRLKANEGFIELLRNAYPDKRVESLVMCIGYSGQPKYLDHAVSSGIDVIVCVENDATGNPLCSVVYGKLKFSQ